MHFFGAEASLQDAFFWLLKVHQIGCGLHPTASFYPLPHTLKPLVHITSLGIKTE